MVTLLRPRVSSGNRVLLVDDDAVALEAHTRVLADAGYAQVTTTTDPHRAIDLVAGGRFDVVLTELRFPMYDGFDLLRAVHAVDPRMPVLVLTADDAVANVVEALRLHAADFLVKPLPPEVLAGRLDTVLAERRSKSGGDVVLAIGAHPDDIEIGAGAALLSHRARADRVAILVMSGGERGGLASGRAGEAQAAADLLGAELLLGDLEDTRIPEHGPSVDLIEEAIAHVGATRIYTHSAEDRHQDHRNTHRAVMVASRTVPRVYGFESPSCTIDYRPTRFETIDEFMEGKLELIACHQSQAAARAYLETDLILATARYWGRFGVSRFAEPFEVLRDVEGHRRAEGWSSSSLPLATDRPVATDRVNNRTMEEGLGRVV